MMTTHFYLIQPNCSMIHTFPTYVLFQSQTEKGFMEGVNFQGICQLIDAHKQVAMPMSGGETLEGSEMMTTALTPEQARAQQLA